MELDPQVAVVSTSLSSEQPVIPSQETNGSVQCAGSTTPAQADDGPVERAESGDVVLKR